MNQNDKRVDILRLLESNLFIFKENFKLIVQECFEVVWQNQASHEALDGFVRAQRLELNRGSFPQIPEVEEEDLLASGPPTSKKPKDPALVSSQNNKVKQGRTAKNKLVNDTNRNAFEHKFGGFDDCLKKGELYSRSDKGDNDQNFKPLN